MISETAVKENLFEAAHHYFEGILNWLTSPECVTMRHNQVEEKLHKVGMELMRLIFQAYLDSSDGDVGIYVVGDDGVERTHKRNTSRFLESIFGRVTVRRVVYQARGVESVFPKDAHLSLPQELYSHGVRKRIAKEAARGSFEEGIDALQNATAAHLPKRQAQQLVERAAQDFDVFYDLRAFEQKAEDEKTSSILVLTCDGKGIVVRHDDLRESTKKAAQRHDSGRKNRLSKGEKRNRKRMATVASVYTIAPNERTPEEVAAQFGPVCEASHKNRPRPENKRVWASLKKKRSAVIHELFDEAKTRDPAQEKDWIVLVDGELNQLADLEREAEARGIQPTFILDIIHVLEYLWKAAYSFEREGSLAAHLWVQKHLSHILQGQSSVTAATIRRAATCMGLEGSKRKNVDTCCNYLLKYGDMMRYNEYLSAGYPIATGVIEGACRSLVKDRMERTGARWSLDGAEAVLRLRALIQSGDFEDYWELHTEIEHQSLHAGNFSAVGTLLQHTERKKDLA